MAAYVQFLGGADIEQQRIFATHLLTASVMSAPAAVVAAKILFPQTEQVDRTVKRQQGKIGTNVLDALSNGTTDGPKLAANVGAMLITFIAVMAMLNYIFEDMIGAWTGLNEVIAARTDYDGLTLPVYLRSDFCTCCLAAGTPSGDVMLVGQLLGEKTVLNEFVAYGSLGGMKAGELFTDPKSIIIATYALCGFSNFSSIGIQIGGIEPWRLNSGPTSLLWESGLWWAERWLVFFTATVAGMLA